MYGDQRMGKTNETRSGMRFEWELVLESASWLWSTESHKADEEECICI